MTRLTAIVTAAASGIGRECTRMLLADGYRVAGVDLKADAIASAFPNAGDKLIPISADIGDVEQCRAADLGTVTLCCDLDRQDLGRNRTGRMGACAEGQCNGHVLPGAFRGREDDST